MIRKLETCNQRSTWNKWITIEIDGWNINNKLDFFNVFKDNINFPTYFWENWDAFWDIITDKDFINQNIYIFIKEYNSMFQNYEDKKIFSSVIIDWLQCKYIDVDIEIYFII